MLLQQNATQFFKNPPIQQKYQNGVLCDNMNMDVFLNHIQDGGTGGQKGPSTSFSSVTSANVRIISQNLLTFSFHLFAILV